MNEESFKHPHYFEHVNTCNITQKHSPLHTPTLPLGMSQTAGISCLHCYLTEPNPGDFYFEIIYNTVLHDYVRRTNTHSAMADESPLTIHLRLLLSLRVAIILFEQLTQVDEVLKRAVRTDSS
eukprot:scpid106877/ scgid31913/ 